MNSDKFDTSWFKLENYDALESLDLRGWCRELSARYHLELWMSFCKSRSVNKNAFCLDFDMENLEGESIRIEKLIQSIKQNPIVNDPFFSVEGDSLVWQDNPAMSKLSTYSVRSTAFIDITRAVLSDDSPNRLARHALACVDDGEIEETKEQYEMAWTPVDFFRPGAQDFATVTIDLTVSDKMIIDDFEKWLKGYRDFMGAEQFKKTNRNQKNPFQNFTKAKLKRWAENRYLAYLDLVLISAFEGNPLKGKKTLISSIIFKDPKTDKGPMTLRNSTYVENAEFLIKPEVLDLMQTQATQYSGKYED